MGGEPDVVRQRFPRRLRLTRARDFDRVLAEGCRSSDQALTVLARANDLPFPRLGLAISRRAAGKAVRRNRVKRIVRESFRCHHARLTGLDVVVIGRSALRSLEGARLRQALERHWRVLNERCERS